MGKKFEIFTLVIFVINILVNIKTHNWVAVFGWFSALIAQTRLIELMD